MKISRCFLTICIASTLLKLRYGYTPSEMEAEFLENELKDEEIEPKQITTGRVSIEEKNIILTLHFAVRSQVEASNMMKMRYYDDIAEKAQILADSCTFEHDKGSNREVTRLGTVMIGQNICIGFSSWSECIYAWINEGNNFEYGIGSKNGGEISHYTQMVLWRTMAIGCGANPCNGTAFRVCNYAYGQYINERKTPWKVGAPCTDCPTNCGSDGFC
ncbi:hypothetical protein ACJMK2_026289, partial [Sinanodonta woodiana]